LHEVFGGVEGGDAVADGLEVVEDADAKERGVRGGGGGGRG
jgi:hypothetical protein